MPTNNIETTRVSAVTGQRSSQNQLEDLFRRVLTTAEPPAPKQEVPDVEKTATSVGEGDTESSSADGIGTDVTLLPRWTAPTTAATWM